MGRGIAEGKKVEEELLNDKKFTEVAINAQRDTFFVFEPSTGKAIRWNKAFSDISGYTDEEIANLKAPESYYSELDLISSAKATEKIGNDGTALLEMNLITKDGQSIPFEYLGTNINDQDGDLKYIVSVGRDIRERKEAENKLKETEKFLSNIFSSIQDGICVLDRDYNIISHNPKIEEWYSHSQPIIGKKCFQAFRNRIDPCEDCECRDILKTGDHFCESEIYKESNGKIDQIFDVYTFPLHDQETGDINGIIKYMRDITGKKKAEQKLKESEEKFRNLSKEYELILDNFPGLIFSKDTKNNFIHVNRNVVASYNRDLQRNEKLSSKKNLEGRNLFDILPREFAQAYWDDDLEVIRSGLPKLNIEESWESEDGTNWISTSKIPFTDENGNVKGIVGISRDITESKNAGDKIKKAHERADMYLNLAGVILVALNRDGIIMLLNKKGYEILEYEEGKLDGRNWFENCLPPQDRQRVHDYFKKLMKDEMDIVPFYENSIITKNKDEKLITWSTILFKDADGKISGLLSSGEDITERRKAEQELKHLSKLKSELLTRTSHELKTPAMHIKGYADLLLHKYKSNLGIDELQIISHIKKGVLRLETLIYDILHKAELDSSQGELIKVQNDLSSLIDLSVRELNSFAALRGHSIILDIDDTIIINFDKEQMRHVINNLITNAIKYTPLNGIIGINSTITDDFITIAIQDNGIGLTEEQIKRLFTHFGKIERYGQGFDIITEGSGLGLHIAKKIIDLHSGKIWVESGGRNKGSIFYFSLPKNNN